MISEHHNRREFLIQLTSLIAGTIPAMLLFNGCAVSGLTSYHQTIVDGKIALELSQYPELGEIGSALQLDVKTLSSPIIVIHVDTQRFAALSPICTHLGCTVRKERSVFRCPCHGSTYALDGTVVRGPAEKSLATYRTEYDSERLVIHLQ